MSFLKKLGQVLLVATKYATGIAPLVPAQAQGVASMVVDKLGQIMQAVVWAEAGGAALGIAGPEKAKLAAPAIAQAILSSTLVAGRKISNPELFKLGVERLGGAVADILSSLKDDVQTEDSENVEVGGGTD